MQGQTAATPASAAAVEDFKGEPEYDRDEQDVGGFEDHMKFQYGGSASVSASSNGSSTRPTTLES
jgi:hypothetical protein